MTIQNALNAAIAHHQAGRLREAEMLYRQILARDPNHADVLHRLGVLAGQVNRHDIELELIRRTVDLQPNFPEARYSLGNALKSNGRLDEAIEAYRQAIALNPKFVDAHNNLGNALRDKGFLDDAIICYRNTLKLAPDYPPAQINLGDTLRLIGDIPEAIECLKRAAAVSPKNPAAIGLLGVALHAAGQVDEAIPLYRQALAIAPDYLDAINNLASALREEGQLDEAVALYRRAVAINPQFAEAHNNLGGALQDAGLIDEAIASFRQAMAISPGFANAYSNLGAILPDKGMLDEAIAVCRRAMELNPDHAEAQANLAKAITDSGRVDEAVNLFRSVTKSNPKLADAHSNLVFSLHFHPEYDSHAILREHMIWDELHAQPFKSSIQPHQNDPSPRRRLRVGYISADFCQHVVGWNLLPLLREHDHGQVEVFCYANVRRPDALTDRFRACADVWRDVRKLDDDKIAQMIRDDRIDILVDLSLHTMHHHLFVFARKPAPVQVTYLGYCSTSGLEAMDYRLSDPHMDPPEVDLSCYREKTIRLPETYWCYQPGGPTPDVVPTPALTCGHVMFGCMNNFAKVSIDATDLWAQVLHQTPGSRLLLYSKLGLHRQTTLERFISRGISADRLEFVGFSPWNEYIHQYERIDIALDPFPYNGGITSCDTLWMGVPMVSLGGRTAVGRAGRSILTNLGLPELIAADPQQYVRLAVELANDLPRLAGLRAGLRERMRRSPLMDAPHFARNVESAYRQMWRTWCESHAKS